MCFKLMPSMLCRRCGGRYAGGAHAALCMHRQRGRCGCQGGLTGILSKRSARSCTALTMELNVASVGQLPAWCKLLLWGA